MDSLGHPDGNLVTLTLAAAARTNKHWREELLTVKPDRVKHQRFYIIENIESQKMKDYNNPLYSMKKLVKAIDTKNLFRVLAVLLLASPLLFNIIVASDRR